MRKLRKMDFPLKEIFYKKQKFCTSNELCIYFPCKIIFEFLRVIFHEQNFVKKKKASQMCTSVKRRRRILIKINSPRSIHHPFSNRFSLRF